MTTKRLSAAEFFQKSAAGLDLLHKTNIGREELEYIFEFAEAYAQPWWIAVSEE